MKNIPQLRFAGFEGEWEERNIKELSNKVTGGGTPSTKIEEYWNGNIPWIQTSDINNDYIKIKKYNKYISSEAIDNSAAKLINSNSISIVTRVGVGKVVKVDHELATSQDFTNLSELNSEITFTTYLLKKTMERLSFILQGTSIKGITQKELLLTKIKLPISNVEQEKIGDLFKKIDALIEKQEGKVSKLEDFKKSMLQKMFPKKGELIPEFRFSGFDGEWKKRKFRDIYKTYESGNRLPKSLLKEGSIPYVLAKTTNNGIHMRIDKDTLDYSGNPMKLFKPNSITFSIDNPEAVFIQNEPFYTSNIMRVFYNENHTRTQTIFYKLQFEKNTRGFDWGIKFSGPVALDSKLFVPFKNNEIDVTEIEKIGQFFKNLDTQIETEEKLLESYKQMKKSLLQKMFV